MNPECRFGEKLSETQRQHPPRHGDTIKQDLFKPDRQAGSAGVACVQKERKFWIPEAG